MAATIVTVAVSGDLTLHVMKGPFTEERVERLMGYLVLRGARHKFKALQERDPETYEKLLNLARNNHWPEFVLRVHKDFDDVVVYYDRVEPMHVPDSVTASQFAHRYTP